MRKRTADGNRPFPRRGDIFYIAGDNAIGSEYTGSHRPAIIVSNDVCNRHSSTVEVVYLTTKFKKNMPTHVEIYSAPRLSTAICEQITTISKERIENFVGHVTEYEMRDINVACAISLYLQDLDEYLLQKAIEEYGDGRYIVGEKKDVSRAAKKIGKYANKKEREK